MSIQTITTPAGEKMVVLPLAEYQALKDALDVAEHVRAREAVARGELEVLSEDEVLAALDAPTPLAFWRGKRGITQKRLGAQVGIGQSYVAELERGTRKGDPLLFKKLAAALGVRMEDLVSD